MDHRRLVAALFGEDGPWSKHGPQEVGGTFLGRTGVNLNCNQSEPKQRNLFLHSVAVCSMLTRVMLIWHKTLESTQNEGVGGTLCTNPIKHLSSVAKRFCYSAPRCYPG
uniref:Uncharacterized protein n=1 Tax=Oncorhynchus kisutch TaxID=8019 RepID=A0A8C7JNV5_ONCKI